MEFLNKLYESEYFIYIIGGVIAVLLILFLVILLSGKKKNKKEEVAETPVANTSAIENAAPATVSLTENLDETKEFKPEDLTDMSNVVVAVPPEETPKEEETVSTPIPEVVEEVSEATPAFTPEVEEPTPMEVVEPVETTPVVETPSEPLLRPQPNNQFSSVFVEDTRPATPLETPAVEPTPLEVAPIETINPEPLAPAEPIVEEPKISFKVEAEELPKLNDENKEL